MRLVAPLLASALLAVLATPGPSAADDPAAETCDFASCNLPSDPAVCATPLPLPSALMEEDPQGGLDAYQTLVSRFFANLCHRALGWRRDKRIRDTGPFTASFTTATGWQGQGNGVHPAVVMYYSPEFFAWLETNRGEEPVPAPPAVPDGAIIVKEMYGGAASDYGDGCVECLAPDGQGLTFMVRDGAASRDGWFWGWYGYASRAVQLDQPPAPGNPLASMGFAPYCLNCHASAESASTFSTLENVAGEPGRPIEYLSQSEFFVDDSVPSHHQAVELAADAVTRLGDPLRAYDRGFTSRFRLGTTRPPSWDDVPGLPSQTYDHVWTQGEKATHFLTSDQCVGCHDAGSTGLQYDMTVPAPADLGWPDRLVNLSPFGEWQASPMGLAGRDPNFFAQLESEAAFHPEYAVTAETICLQCHGILGQRQAMIDNGCEIKKDPYRRATLEKTSLATAWDPAAAHGALSRDGISCQACHRYTMDGDVCDELGLGDELCDSLAETAPPDPGQNKCLEVQRSFETPGLTGFAETFLGNYPVTAADRLLGPFEDPKQKPMDHAVGILPEASALMKQSEVCGSCHTIYLPVLDAKGECVKRTYEQTTYPEWVFSAFRTPGFGTTPGADPKSCQQCHMKTTYRDEELTSKIASIQEVRGFPQFPYLLEPEELDLEQREDFARHTLVGLNAFFVEMAQQFPDVLGIRTTDPMLVSFGVPPLVTAEQSILDQAQDETVSVKVAGVTTSSDGSIEAKVELESQVGHKFPSGVGFRRAILELAVVDDAGDVLWISGGTDGLGLVLGKDGKPLRGELWWEDDCSRRRPDSSVVAKDPAFQPHYQVIESQDQAQIYQEIVRTPLASDPPGSCPNPPPKLGKTATPPRVEAPGMFTTSFLGIGGHVKDNRILPKGWDPDPKVAATIGDPHLAEEVLPRGVGDDPEYRPGAGGGDHLTYRIPAADLAGRKPAAVRARLYFQATPPSYLQDRFCAASTGRDTGRLYFLAGHLNVDGTAVDGWKLQVGETACVGVDGEESGVC